MEPQIEFAGCSSPAGLAESRRAALARAPLWVRNLANRGLRAAAAQKFNQTRPGRAKATPPAKPRWAGWIAGIACSGVSVPTYSPTDKRTLPEQFTDDALAALARQASRDVPLTWGHDGPKLCSTRGLDMVFRHKALLGLTFTARLRDTAQNRRILQDIGDGFIGVSIGFTGSKGWTVERDGIGTVRIVNAATIDHVALIPRSSGLKPAYPTAWAAASIGHRDLCPAVTSVRAELKAYAEMKRQAGIRC